MAGSGYHECISPAGTVLLRRGGRPFAPDTDLVNPALQLVDVLELDHYRVDGATMATEIPYEWLAQFPQPRRVNRRVTGCAQINAQPYPKTSTSRCAPPGCASDRPAQTVRSCGARQAGARRRIAEPMRYVSFELLLATAAASAAMERRVDTGLRGHGALRWRQDYR